MEVGWEFRSFLTTKPSSSSLQSKLVQS
uniref:Uncharacterized protein n=1 Tax=Anguilla anguilla TaxID=7936 RepID=A0A0E9QJZ9_ANGAN